jgi:hypothetical protein
MDNSLQLHLLTTENTRELMQDFLSTDEGRLLRAYKKVELYQAAVYQRRKRINDLDFEIQVYKWLSLPSGKPFVVSNNESDKLDSICALVGVKIEIFPAELVTRLSKCPGDLVWDDLDKGSVWRLEVRGRETNPNIPEFDYDTCIGSSSLAGLKARDMEIDIVDASHIILSTSVEGRYAVVVARRGPQ